MRLSLLCLALGACVSPAFLLAEIGAVVLVAGCLVAWAFAYAAHDTRHELADGYGGAGVGVAHAASIISGGPQDHA